MANFITQNDKSNFFVSFYNNCARTAKKNFCENTICIRNLDFNGKDCVTYYFTLDAVPSVAWDFLHYKHTNLT